MAIDKLIADLSSESEKTRQTALIKLQEMPLEKFIDPLAELILSHTSTETYASCLDLLERFDAVVSMVDLRTDGWFDKISERVSHFTEICDVIGHRFLAYSFILGIQIRSIMLDPNSPWNTSVNFSINDEQIQTLSLGEFKLQLVQALLHDERLPIQVQFPFGPESAAAVLGGRTMLLAPLFGISIERVMVASLDSDKPRYIVSYLTDEGLNIQDVADFLLEIREFLNKDVSGIADKPVTLDLFAVQRAREAFEQGDNDKVVSALESWPGLLSMLLRTPVAKQLDDEQLMLISEGLCLLGEALEKNDRQGWSEELYKLGLQFVREGNGAERLFWNFARVVYDKGEYGIAIGLLRRALSLGHDEAEVLPLLGHAFLKQDKPVAAAALLKRAEAVNATYSELEADLKTISELLESKGITWSVPTPGART